MLNRGHQCAFASRDFEIDAELIDEYEPERQEFSEEVQSKERHAPPFRVLTFELLNSISVDGNGAEDSSVEIACSESHCDEALLSIVLLVPQTFGFQVSPQYKVCGHHQDEGQVEEYCYGLPYPIIALSKAELYLFRFVLSSPLPEQGSTIKTAYCIHMPAIMRAITTYRVRLEYK